MVNDDLTTLSNMGVNTIYLTPEYPLNENNPNAYTSTRLLELVDAARNAGFAVIFCPSLNVSGISSINDVADYLSGLKQYVADYISSLEEHKVEYLSPGNEVYNFIANQLGYTPGTDEANSLWNTVNDWHQEVVTEISSSFNGRFIYKAAQYTDGAEGYSQINCNNYNHYAPTAFIWGNPDTMLSQLISGAKIVRTRDGCGWFIGEYWLDRTHDQEVNDVKGWAEEGFNYLDANAGDNFSGLSFGSWAHPDGITKDTDIQTLIQNWFPTH